MPLYMYQTIIEPAKILQAVKMWMNMIFAKVNCAQDWEWKKIHWLFSGYYSQTAYQSCMQMISKDYSDLRKCKYICIAQPPFSLLNNGLEILE